jgi:hypothetical protein
MIHYVCSAYFRCLIQNFWWNVPPNAILKPGPESRQVLHPHVISQNMLGFGFWCILFIYLFHLFGKKTWSRRWKPRRDIPSISGATALASDIQHGSKVCDEGCSMVVIGCNWDLETYDPPKSSQVISSHLKSSQVPSDLWTEATKPTLSSDDKMPMPHFEHKPERGSPDLPNGWDILGPVQRRRCSDAVEWLVSLADCKLRKVYQVLTCFNF